MTNELIKHFEGFRSKPYLDDAGVATIGYGTIKYPDWYVFKNKDPEGDVLMTDPEVSEKLASDFVDEFVRKEVDPAMNYIKTPLNLNQKEAIKSFIYNLGVTNFKDSTLLKKINKGDLEDAAAEFTKWINVGGKINKGLIKRRTQELILFLKPAYKSNKVEVANCNKDMLFFERLKSLFKKGD